MKLLLFFCSLMIAQTGFSSVIDINCTTPERFAGQAATLKGKLNKSAQPSPEGYYLLSGELKITVGGSTSRSLYDKTVQVNGGILNDISLSLGSEKNPELEMIYINTKRQELSYVELNGKMFGTDCTKVNISL